MCNEVPTHGECGVAGAQLMVDLLVDMVDLWPVCLRHLHQARQNMLRNVPVREIRRESGKFHRLLLAELEINPSNVEATFVQSTRMQRFFKTI